MPNLNVVVPKALKAQIDRRIADGDYDSADEYVRELLRRDQQRSKQRELEAFLVKRLDRSKAVEMNAHDFDRIRQRVGRIVRNKQKA